MFGTIILFLVILSLLVFVHELGHFVMARKMGMKVDEFGFGFPPRMFGIKKNDTVYSVNWIPLGGFVKIKGESGENAYDPDSFASKPVWRRFLVLVAGVSMNLVLAAVLLGIGFMIGLPSVLTDDIPASASVRDEAIRIVQVLPDSPAETAGLKLGDVVVSIDDRLFDDASEAREYLSTAEEAVSLNLRRGDDVITKEVTRKQMNGSDEAVIGVAMVRTGFVSYGFFESIGRGVVATIDMTIQIVQAFWNLISSLVRTASVDVDLSGPVGIAVLTGQVAELGIGYLIQFTAILSINLAVLNILPFPALDGGRVLFLAIEKIRRRRLNANAEALTHNIGFLILIALVVVVTYKDIVRFGDEIVGAITSIF